MLRRPLVPLLVALSGGIAFGHLALPSSPGIGLLLIPAIALCLLNALLISRSAAFSALLLTVFLLGAFLDADRHRNSRLGEWAEAGRRVTLEGTVIEPIRTLDGTARIRVRVRMLETDRGPIALDENVHATVYTHPPLLDPGEKIRFPAKLSPFRNFLNPGAYDYVSGMNREGFSCAAAVSDGRNIVPMGGGRLPFPDALLERMRKPVRAFFQDALSPESSALLRALILGERQGLKPGDREPFNRSGLAHILAISGLHVGLIAWLSFLFFRAVLSGFTSFALDRDIRKPAAFLTCFPVVAYVSLAGYQVSSQRAMIMVLAFLGSMILGRERDVWSTLALAGFVILMLAPHDLFSISFQLSFGAVVGILWLAPPILKRLRTGDGGRLGGRPVLRKLLLYGAGLVAASASASLFLSPIVAHYFHRLSPAAIPANLTVVPLLGFWVLPLALLAVLALPVVPGLAEILLHGASWGLEGMRTLAQFWAALPGASVWVVTPNLFEISLFYLLLLTLYFFKRSAMAKKALVLALLMVIGDAAYWVYSVRFHSDLRVTFLDVGKGNAAFLALPGGKNMLIDGGGFSQGRFDVGKMVVAPSLWRAKVTKVHYLVLSHPQSDHMNGLRFIAGAFGPDEFWTNGDMVDTPSFVELMDILKKRGVRILFPEDLEEGRFVNGVQLKAIHPMPAFPIEPGTSDGRELNNRSLVLKASFGGYSLLFPGDIEQEAEAWLVSTQRAALKSDVLLCPHHGSDSSGSRRFLQAVRPRLCVVSCREGGPRPLPRPAVLDRLKGLGCRVLRTGRDGAVFLSILPGRMEVRTYTEHG